MSRIGHCVSLLHLPAFMDSRSVSRSLASDNTEPSPVVFTGIIPQSSSPIFAFIIIFVSLLHKWQCPPWVFVPLPPPSFSKFLLSQATYPQAIFPSTNSCFIYISIFRIISHSTNPSIYIYATPLHLYYINSLPGACH